jgi:hypothetical protein
MGDIGRLFDKIRRGTVERRVFKDENGNPLPREKKEFNLCPR